ncbi:hypothetical protein [Nonomuraea sp. NPDC049784]|uniref:hypothetical protein n=1 Tax=Nonomuraea sp. NPDC049784 TaxID=3154361 RepID=UPI0033E47645
MPVSQAGVASSLVSTFRQTGSALGVAVIGAVLASRIDVGAYTAAARPAWWIIAGCGLTVLIVGQLTNTRRAQRTAQRTSHGLRRAFAKPQQRSASLTAHSRPTAHR